MIPVRGVHRIYGDAVVAGERWVTCSCGGQWKGQDMSAVWSTWWSHSQSRDRRQR